jgi:hypothetical protein
MGRYFSIGNYTQDHKISEGDRCWEDKEHCDINSVMHKFHWDPLDSIFTACKGTYCTFKFDSKTLQIAGQYYDDINVVKKYAFLMDEDDIKFTRDHIPIWTTNFFVIRTNGSDGEEHNLRRQTQCVVCGYIYDVYDLDRCEDEYEDTHLLYDSASDDE